MSEFSTGELSRRASGSGLFGSQIAEQLLERLLESVVVFPVGEVGDEILAHFLGQVPAGIGVEAPPGFDL